MNEIGGGWEEDGCVKVGGRWCAVIGGVLWRWTIASVAARGAVICDFGVDVRN